ncbi:MAG: major facilitator superfamily 1 [Acidimicrobiaceae bacterium]|nr:major facilitator superfamily 1 [Acidimicrobiaceae bacterium]
MSLTSRAPARATIALAVIVTCQLMVVLDATVVNIALVPIKRSLHFSTADLSWVIDAYSLAFGGLLLLGGRAGDVFGRRRMLMVGLFVFTLASLLGGFATSAGWLLATRALQGVGAALASPSTLSLISATFEEGAARNKALGVFTAVSAGGGSLGLVLGGALTSWFSWRWVLFINVPIGIAVLLLAPRYVTEPPRNGGKVDVAGAVLVTSGLAGVIYAFIRLAERASSGVTIGSFVAGALLLSSFLVVERRRAQPLMPTRILFDRVRGPAYLDFLLVPAVMYGVFFFISQYLEANLHFSAIRAGLGFLPLTGLIFASSRVTPKLVGRIGARPILLFGLVLLAGATLWISQANPSEGYFASLFGPMLLFGLGAGSCFLPLSVTILAGVPRNDSGAASGMLQTMQQTGAALGVAALSSIAISHGRSDALLAGAGIVLVALAVAGIAIRPVRRAQAPTAEELAEEAPVLALSE